MHTSLFRYTGDKKMYKKALHQPCPGSPNAWESVGGGEEERVGSGEEEGVGWAGGSQVMHTICGAEQHVAYLRYTQQINHFPILPGYAGIKPVQRVKEMDRAP